MNPDLATGTEEEYMPSSEIRVALQELTDTDSLRLKMIARCYAARCPMDENDLMQEAFLRALSGERKCPRGVPLIAFLAETMRSIASNERRKGKFIRLLEPSEENPSDNPILSYPDGRPSPEKIAAAEQEVETIFKLFADDEDVGMLLMGITEDYDPDEICDLNEWSRTNYDTVRRRMRRKLNNRFPKGRQT
jgi:DNA-directed RNA polymerase specialized sigma24 family protein